MAEIMRYMVCLTPVLLVNEIAYQISLGAAGKAVELQRAKAPDLRQGSPQRHRRDHGCHSAGRAVLRVLWPSAPG